MTELTLGIPEVKVFEVPRCVDERGYFSETYSKQRLNLAEIPAEFVQDNQSFSRDANTLRGLHLQAPPFAQGKLVRVTRGSILDVCVDVRIGSPTFGKWVSAVISEEKWNQIFVPVGFLHGFITLEPNTEVQYKVSNYYDKASERGVIWNDPDLGIDWKVGTNTDVKLSSKDGALPSFRDFVSPFVY